MLTNGTELMSEDASDAISCLTSGSRQEKEAPQTSFTGYAPLVRFSSETPQNCYAPMFFFFVFFYVRR